MTLREELELFGQPIEFVLPKGDLVKSKYPKSYNYPDLEGGLAYRGYVLFDIDDSPDFNKASKIFILINDDIYDLGGYFDYYRDVKQYITKKQKLATYDNIRKALLFLYQKIDDLQEQLYSKVDM